MNIFSTMEMPDFRNIYKRFQVGTMLFQSSVFYVDVNTLKRCYILLFGNLMGKPRLTHIEVFLKKNESYNAVFL